MNEISLEINDLCTIEQINVKKSTLLKSHLLQKSADRTFIFFFVKFTFFRCFLKLHVNVDVARLKSC